MTDQQDIDNEDLLIRHRRLGQLRAQIEQARSDLSKAKIKVGDMRQALARLVDQKEDEERAMFAPSPLFDWAAQNGHAAPAETEASVASAVVDGVRWALPCEFEVSWRDQPVRVRWDPSVGERMPSPGGGLRFESDIFRRTLTHAACEWGCFVPEHEQEGNLREYAQMALTLEMARRAGPEVGDKPKRQSKKKAKAPEPSVEL